MFSSTVYSVTQYFRESCEKALVCSLTVKQSHAIWPRMYHWKVTTVRTVQLIIILWPGLKGVENTKQAALLLARSISFPGSTPICLRYVRIALTSFQGLTRVGRKCPAWGTGRLGLAQGAWRHHDRASDRSNPMHRISSCQWLTRMSTAGSTQGS